MIRINFGPRWRRPAGQSVEGRGLGSGLLFCGVFALAGLLVAGWIGREMWHARRAQTVYLETTGVILEKELKVSRARDGGTYDAVLTYRYQVGGRQYVTSGYSPFSSSSSNRWAKERILNQFTVDESYPVWYDPDDPERAVLTREVGWEYLWLLFPLPFLLVGFGGIGALLWGAAKDRRERAAAAARGEPLRPAVKLPFPPARTSPGRLLRVRLRRETSVAAEIGCLLGVTLFWNGITGVFVGICITGWASGDVPRWLPLFLTPFVLVGLGLIFTLLQKALAHGRVRETVVEVDQEPAPAGARVQLRVAQPGRVALHALTVTLVCEEQARYTRGTSTYTDKERCLERELLRAGPLEVKRGQKWEQYVTLDLPPDAAPSFEANHNEVVWLLEVKGEVVRWPNFEHRFPLRVVPPEAVGRLS